MATRSAPFFLRAAAATTAGGVGALGGLGVVAYLQARLAGSSPSQPPHTLDAHIGEGGVHRRVVWLGDSLAAGLGAISPSMSLPHHVASYDPRPTRLHVFATHGATSVDVVRDQLPALELLRRGLAEIGERVDAVGVSVGANDIAAFTPRHRLRQNLATIVDAAEGAPVVFLSIPHLGDAIRLPNPLRSFASARARWLDRELQRIGNRPTVRYASVRHRPPWITRADRANFLSGDRFHPSGAGYALWAHKVASAFEQASMPLAGSALLDPA